MTQLQTPKASRNQDTGRVRTAGVCVGVCMDPSMRLAARTPPIGSPAGEHSGEAPSTVRGRRGTFTDVPTTSHPPRYAAKRRYRPALAAAASLLLSALSTVPAAADTNNPADGRGAPRTPPARMSTVGGELLGKPGTQVRLEAGAPQLPKDITGRSWLVADAESGEILASHNAHWQLPPASTLKMLFADTVLPKLPRDKTHKVAASDLAGMGAGSSAVGVHEGSSYSVHDLWLGVFLRSGNDAVRVLSTMNGGIPQTVKDMQAHANDLQANDTHVVSPDGYDAEGQVSSAYDLTLFARSGLQKADFREYCSTVSAQFPEEEKPGEKRKTSTIVNTNRLLTGQNVPAYKGMAGVKNGSTTNAGNTFTGVAQHDGRKLLVTVMNPEKAEPYEVYTETAKLLDWGFEAAGHVKPVGVLVPPKGTAGKSGDAAGRPSADSTQASVAGGGGGMWTAVGIAGGVLAALAVAGVVVHRRHPLPELVRRKK
ncbi:D-alanyl-D-alanine carboxypeptidase [Streptomyces sp. UNOC14_S4]|nr:D-alanyl-D-alanine carboxypeptidase [Streptomyces sp. UNOC14_S4]